MNTKDWLHECHVHRQSLRNLIGGYHPVARDPTDIGMMCGLDITAPAAQKACDAICEEIKNSERGELPPVRRFDYALQVGDVATIHSLLSATWFGVPESTSCWSITGFNELVNLLDDPPEEDYD